MPGDRNDNDFENDPWSRRAVDPVAPNRPTDRLHGEKNPRPPSIESLRLRNWDIQQKKQQGREWDYNFKIQILKAAVREANAELLKSETPFRITVVEDRPHFRLELTETSKIGRAHV